MIIFFVFSLYDDEINLPTYKKGWSHPKLNKNNLDIPFPKALRIYQ